MNEHMLEHISKLWSEWPDEFEELITNAGYVLPENYEPYPNR